MSKFRASKLKVKAGGRNGKIKIIVPSQPVQLKFKNMPMPTITLSEKRTFENLERINPRR